MPVDPRTIARLADLHEFAELKRYFDEQREADIQALARKTFAQPAEHDQIEWERKKSFYAGVDAVLALPVKARDSLRKESQ
jgi:hypothetical protein